MFSYLLKTKKSDDPSAKSTFTDGIPLLDLSEISEKEIVDTEGDVYVYYMKYVGWKVHISNLN